MLQCVAVCCSVLQYVAVPIYRLHHTAPHRSTIHTQTCCNSVSSWGVHCPWPPSKRRAETLWAGSPLRSACKHTRVYIYIYYVHMYTYVCMHGQAALLRSTNLKILQHTATCYFIYVYTCSDMLQCVAVFWSTYLLVYTYTYIYMRTRVSTYIHECIYIHICTYILVYTWIYLDVYMCIYIYSSMHTYTHIYVYTCIHICIYIYVYISIYMYS